MILVILGILVICCCLFFSVVAGGGGAYLYTRGPSEGELGGPCKSDKKCNDNDKVCKSNICVEKCTVKPNTTCNIASDIPHDIDNKCDYSGCVAVTTAGTPATIAGTPSSSTNTTTNTNVPVGSPPQPVGSPPQPVGSPPAPPPAPLTLTEWKTQNETLITSKGWLPKSDAKCSDAKKYIDVTDSDLPSTLNDATSKTHAKTFCRPKTTAEWCSTMTTPSNWYLGQDNFLRVQFPQLIAQGSSPRTDGSLKIPLCSKCTDGKYYQTKAHAQVEDWPASESANFDVKAVGATLNNNQAKFDEIKKMMDDKKMESGCDTASEYYAGGRCWCYQDINKSKNVDYQEGQPGKCQYNPVLLVDFTCTSRYNPTQVPDCISDPNFYKTFDGGKIEKDCYYATFSPPPPPTPPASTSSSGPKCCWNRAIQGCSQNSDCDALSSSETLATNACRVSGTPTSTYGSFACNTCEMQGKTYDQATCIDPNARNLAFGANCLNNAQCASGVCTNGKCNIDLSNFNFSRFRF